MSKKLLLLLFSLTLVFLASGCKPECEDHQYASFEILLDSPPFGELVSYLDPLTFDWHHNEECEPLAYIVHLKDLVNGAETSFGGELDDTEFTYTGTGFWDDLEFRPNRQYEWYVTATNMGQKNLSPPSQTWRFTTDGLCAAHELVPPVLFRPLDQNWLELKPPPDNLRLIWEYPDECFPEFYHYQLAADPAFTNIVTSGITEFSDTVCGEQGDFWCFSKYYQELNHKIVESVKTSIPECARIYWRVEARRGNDSGGWSDVYRFTNASKRGCWQTQQSIDAALIKGFIFDDYCKNTQPWIPDGVEIFPPCVFGEPYGVHADGARNRSAYEHEVTGETVPAEPGIPGVIVDLGAGPCPSTGLDQTVTLQNGGYFFFVQSPGEYCVSVNMDKNPALDHGIWTRPLTNQRTAERTITFEEGDDLMIENFGWDKNDFIKIDFWVHLTSFCRAGDTINHLKLAVVEEGSVIPLIRRNESGTWFETIVNGIPCLISIESGEPDGDIHELGIFDPYPKPEPTPEPKDKSSTPNCAKYTDIENCNNNPGCNWELIPAAIPVWMCVPK